MTIHINQDDNADQSSASTPEGPNRPYTLVLRGHLELKDVTWLLHYVSDFGTGDARGHAYDGRWCIRLSEIRDVRLLISQCGDIIVDFLVRREAA